MSKKDDNKDHSDKYHSHFAITQDELPWRLNASNTDSSQEINNNNKIDNSTTTNSHQPLSQNFIAPEPSPHHEHPSHDNDSNINNNIDSNKKVFVDPSAAIETRYAPNLSIQDNKVQDTKNLSKNIPPHHSINAPPLPNDHKTSSQQQPYMAKNLSQHYRPTLEEIRRLVQEKQHQTPANTAYDKHEDSQESVKDIENNIAIFPKKPQAYVKKPMPQLPILGSLQKKTSSPTNVTDFPPHIPGDNIQHTDDTATNDIKMSETQQNDIDNDSSDQHLNKMQTMLRQLNAQTHHGDEHDNEDKDNQKTPQLKKLELRDFAEEESEKNIQADSDNDNTKSTDDVTQDITISLSVSKETKKPLDDIPAFMRIAKNTNKSDISQSYEKINPSNDKDTRDGLRVISIEKSYKKHLVLKDISLHIKRGEVIGILGPNGAGKTTCFYIVTGLIHPDMGHITLDGINITEEPMYRRARSGIGYLPQESSIFRGLNVEDNIMVVLQTIEKDKKKRKERCYELMEDFGIVHLAKSTATSLSGGERRRLEIARAIATNPEFMLLDEPFAGIDPIAVQDIRDLVTTLTNRNIGVLITDHNVRETLDIVHRAYILHGGNILCEGTSDDIINNDDVRAVYLGENFKI